ncbi:MAG: CRISPR system precrRNA processing endoribonuclease RAMP protein Cas6 [Desulfuromonadaceae bacterium]|nr:CRISPR system precrRNA processing endoribonuclease RAMP protein Cas6 [Desulfuromonadaceae bacterium]
MDLDFVLIECEIVSDSPAQLTAALYSALRNFESKFKTSCCLMTSESCTTCRLHVECPYWTVFHQGLSSNPEIVRLHQKPSLPFSLHVIGKNGNVSTCTVGLVIVGSALNYIEFFHAALVSMIEGGASTVLSPAKFILSNYSLDYQGDRHAITQPALLPESVILLSGQYILQNSVHSDSIRLNLKSPLRLLSNGSIAHRFDFGMFLRSQMRRCSSLWAYYGTGKLDIDFAFLSESAQNVAVFDDKIQYTQPSWSRRLNRSGLAGTAECAGLVEPMLSLLTLGSYFNAGKGATFGSGYYQLEVID